MDLRVCKTVPEFSDDQCTDVAAALTYYAVEDVARSRRLRQSRGTDDDADPTGRPGE